MKTQEDKLIEHTLRDGGPMDTTFMPETKCLKCGEMFTENLRWHYTNNGICPLCGGDIDREPIIGAILEIIRAHRAALARLKP